MPVTICFDRTYICDPLADLLRFHKRTYIYALWHVSDDGDSREMNDIVKADQYKDKYDALLEKHESSLTALNKARYLADREQMSGCRCMAWVYYEINRCARNRRNSRTFWKVIDQLQDAQTHFKEHLAKWEAILRESDETDDYLSFFWACCKLSNWEASWRSRMDEALGDGAEAEQKIVGRKNLLVYAEMALKTAEFILDRKHIPVVAALADEARQCLAGQIPALVVPTFFYTFTTRERPTVERVFGERASRAYLGVSAEHIWMPTSLTWPGEYLAEPGRDIREKWLTGHELWQEERFEEAFNAFESALSIPPENAEDWSERGLVLLALGLNGKGDPMAMVESFEKACELEPEVGAYYTNLGFVREQQGEDEQALGAYTRAATLDGKTDSRCWSNMASALYRLGSPEEALKCCRDALDLDAKNIGALFLLGKLSQCFEGAEDSLEIVERIFALTDEKGMEFPGIP